MALASGNLPAGVAIIRLSGPKSIYCLEQLAGAVPGPRILSLRNLIDPQAGALLDQGLVVCFPAPHSFTGEDCVELQLHGSRAVVNAVLNTLTSFPDVRLAGPGEFTRRAFENGRLDLVEVDALGDLIAADTENQRSLAMARLGGDVTVRIEQWRDDIIDLMAEVEAQLDFSDEGDVSDLSQAALVEGLAGLTASLEAGLHSYQHGRIVRDGFRVGLGGVPNAGKSSLLNMLAKSDVAIVTEEAGTTRDLREVAIDLNGQLVLLIDSAGIRDTDSLAEAEGVRRAIEMLGTADLVLWLQAPDIDADQSCPVTGPQVVLVQSKADLAEIEGPLSVSTKSETGVKALLDLIDTRVAAEISGFGDVSMSHLRDREALSGCIAEIKRAADNSERLELVAESLRRAVLILERLVGRVDAEQILDRLFAGFCIGK